MQLNRLIDSFSLLTLSRSCAEFSELLHAAMKAKLKSTSLPSHAWTTSSVEAATTKSEPWVTAAANGTNDLQM